MEMYHNRVAATIPDHPKSIGHSRFADVKANLSIAFVFKHWFFHAHYDDRLLHVFDILTMSEKCLCL